MADNDILTDAAAAEIKQRVRCTGRCLSDVAALLADRRARIAELAARDGEVGRLREALELLESVQNGCPLYKYEADWNRAMAMTDALLRPTPEPRP